MNVCRVEHESSMKDRSIKNLLMGMKIDTNVASIENIVKRIFCPFHSRKKGLAK